MEGLFMTIDVLEQYKEDAIQRAKSYMKNEKLQNAKNIFLNELVSEKYAYNFFWLGTPILQAPQDLQSWQEIIWEVKPDLIIETGVAMGGSLIFNASMLSILENCKLIEKGDVIGVDIEIRPHNKKAITEHPLNDKITLVEGSSIDEKIIQKVKELAKNKKRILIILDSNHTHDHVLAELRAYGPLVSKGSYCIVSDTGVEDLPEGSTSNRPWGKGNNPKTAVWEFLKENDSFKIDKDIEAKLILTASPDGFLKRTE
jgi:cephalosporin hydroxylase